MRILIVTPWYPTQRAPHNGVFVAREAAALATAHDVVVLHLDWTGGAGDTLLSPQGVNARRVDLRRVRPLDYVRARRLVRAAARCADVVHTHALTGLLPWLLGRPSDLPWVHTEHWSALTSPESLSPALRAALTVLRPLLNRPDVVIAESTRLADAVRAHRRGAVAIVPCVVPPAPLVDPPEAPPLRLIGIGGLVSRKGPLLAVAAVADLASRGVDVRLVWAGEGPQRPAVEAAARRLGVEDRVALRGALPPSEVLAELDAAHLLLLPTQGDNFCVATAESLVQGRPIVSGSNTGAVDYAQPHVSRFVVEQTGRAYADAVLDLREATARLSAQDVATTVQGRFTSETVRALLDDVYRSAGVASG